jgi:hypothetical protein
MESETVLTVVHAVLNCRTKRDEVVQLKKEHHE